jgi:hypothetical protein
MHLLTVFLISGGLHVIAECCGGGLPVEVSGTMRFFVTQVAGIIIEDTAQELWRRLIGDTKINIRNKVVGYIWVMSFLVWSTPAWLYPQAARPSNQSILPFSIIKFLGGYFK